MDQVTLSAKELDTLFEQHTPGVVVKRCGYRTGKCENPQALKRNGTLHKLCEYHRGKANENQKKLDRKKRQQRAAPYPGAVSPPHSPKVVCNDMSPRSAEEMFCKQRPLSPMNLSDDLAPISLTEPPQAWHLDEVAIFCDIMNTPNPRHHMARRMTYPLQSPKQTFHHYAHQV
ncbi:TPA: hypothetical protein N0F65_011071 [Lagenidium giganteum]|uniref:Uncharacterized protein n=1 Tax=Lagenidium giganteum TaxID=4803 RepID=A0AAV2ZC13_9STRA|nr:TPA: hypothetical protein N0F65_011071 [Lagenidium giganteum]